MHSSRMRTGRSLTVCCCVLLGGGGSAWSGGRGGSPWSGGGSPWSRGVLLGPGGGLPGPGGFSLVLGGGGSPWSGGVLLGPGGVSLVRGGSLETPPVNRITDMCKHITLATTSLRPVTSSNVSRSGGRAL